MNDSDVFVFVFLVLVVVAFWTEIREFVTFIMGILFAVCLLLLSWFAYMLLTSVVYVMSKVGK